MSLHKALHDIAGGLVDLHVGLNRARHFADELYAASTGHVEYFHELYEELDQMQLEIERLMREVK